MINLVDIDKVITVFAYAFPHKKTYDFLNIIKSHGFKNVTVIGAPKVKLKNKPNRELFSKLPLFSPRIDCESLCQILNFRYVESKHDDVDYLKNKLTKDELSGNVLISGARILSKETIGMFNSGVVNFHPGKIPDTSGLDSFYWMMKNGAQPGVTVHKIDHRVDAGEEIFFHEVELSCGDTPAVVEYKIYNAQLLALERFLALIKVCKEIKTTKIERPFKNSPMSVTDKEICLSNFNKWRNSTCSFQSKIKKIIQNCVDDNISELKDMLSTDIVNYKVNNGWSPLSVASFNHSYKCCEYLIENGANVNISSDKGTTPLMYAKTKNVNEKLVDLSIASLLLEGGANLYQKDYLNNNVFHYIENSDYPELSELIKVL